MTTDGGQDMSGRGVNREPGDPHIGWGSDNEVAAWRASRNAQIGRLASKPPHVPVVGCAHDSGYCDEDAQQSGCNECEEVRPRCDCGEWDDATEALDRLGVAIDPDHIMQSPERQWRIIAAEMAMLLSDEQLAGIRAGHQKRVNPNANL